MVLDVFSFLGRESDRVLRLRIHTTPHAGLALEHYAEGRGITGVLQEGEPCRQLLLAECHDGVAQIFDGGLENVARPCFDHWA